MVLNVELTQEIESRLRSEAKRLGITEDALAIRLLDKALPPPELSAEERMERLRVWLKQREEEIDAMTDEELASNEEVFRAIDSHRPHRKLFDLP